MHFLIVDDHALIVQALSLLLKTRFPDCEIHTGATAQEALKLVDTYGDETDLMLLDLNLPDVSEPTELLQELVKNDLTMKILVLSGLTEHQQIMRVLMLGASGFIPKSLDPAMLTNAIDFVLKGGVYIPTQLLGQSQKEGIFQAATPKEDIPYVHLTDRQKDVLMALARGLPIKRICRELDLSEGTVKTHVSAIYRAFGATNRTEALLAAKKAGFSIDL